jgi:hypothetical protein
LTYLQQNTQVVSKDDYGQGQAADKPAAGASALSRTMQTRTVSRFTALREGCFTLRQSGSKMKKTKKQNSNPAFPATFSAKKTQTRKTW